MYVVHSRTEEKCDFMYLKVGKVFVILLATMLLPVRGEVQIDGDPLQENVGLESESAENLFKKIQTLADLKTVEKKAGSGSAEAQHVVAMHYIVGAIVAPDIERGVGWLTKSADQGYANALYDMGFVHARGWFVETNAVAAVECWRKAAEQKNSRAMHQLGLSFLAGYGVETNHQEAVKWFRIVADMGNFKAQHNLAVAYYEGKGVNKDLVEAYAWASIASRRVGKAAKLTGTIRKELSREELEKARERAAVFRARFKETEPEKKSPESISEG